MLRRRRRCCAGHCPAMQAEQCCCLSQNFRGHGPQQCLSFCRAGARRLRLFEGVWSGKGDAGLTRAQDSGGHQPDHECHHSARAQPASALTLLCSSDTGSNPNNGHNVSNRCPRLRILSELLTACSVHVPSSVPPAKAFLNVAQLQC